MAKPKKHIAIQENFPFTEEVTKSVQECPPKDVETDNSVKTTIDQLNVSGELTTPISAPQESVDSANYATVEPTKKNIPPVKFSRNSYGLYSHIDYVFHENGFVDWRAMIPIKYLYVGKNIKDNPVRREMFEKKYGKKPEKVDLTVDKIEDDDLLITLAGIRYLASLRGYTRVTFDTAPSTLDYSSVNCRINWIKNFETENSDFYGEVTFDGVACATSENTYSFTRNYLPEIASNRAFCRAVRNFLNIDIVSDEEAFDKKLSDSTLPPTTSTGTTPYGQPHEVLKAKMEEKGVDFPKLKASMIKYCTNNPEKKETLAVWEKAESVLDLTSIQIFDVIGLMKKKDKEKEKLNEEKE